MKINLAIASSYFILLLSPTSSAAEAVEACYTLKKGTTYDMISTSSVAGTSTEQSMAYLISEFSDRKIQTVLTMSNSIIITTTSEKSEDKWIQTIETDSPEVEGFPSMDACLLYTSPSPRDATLSRMPSSA